jgi:hypothetical protein
MEKEELAKAVLKEVSRIIEKYGSEMSKSSANIFWAYEALEKAQKYLELEVEWWRKFKERQKAP